MEYVKVKSGIIDFKAGGFLIVFVASALAALSVVLFNHVEQFKNFLYLLVFNLPDSLMQQFGIISENRIDPKSSVVILGVCSAVSVLNFFIFLYLIPAQHVTEKYLRSNYVKNYLSLFFHA